jgi:putative metallohydrolase (TIGR04338 family)
VYEAEGVLAGMIDRRTEFPLVSAFGSQVAVPDDRKFGDVDAVQRYVDAVLALEWVRDGAPTVAPVRVRARNGATRAEYEFETRTIALPTHRVGGRWAMRELVVLHELAHHLTGGGTADLRSEVAADPGYDAPHGPCFVRRLLRLIDGIVGPEAEFLLRSLLLDAGVAVR